MRSDMPRAFVACVLTVSFVLSAFMAIGVPAIGTEQRDASRADLTVTAETEITGTQAYDNVFIMSGGTLKVPSGGTLYAKAVLNQGGSIYMDGGTISIDLSGAGIGADAVISGHGYNFIMKNSAKIILKGGEAGNTVDLSQGGNAQVTGNYTGVIRIDDSTIECTGGNAKNIVNPWNYPIQGIALSGWESAGGSADVSLRMDKDSLGLDTIYIKNSRFAMTGGNAGSASSGKDGGWG